MTTWGRLLAHAGRRYRDRIAIRAHGETRTYGQLIEHAARLANTLTGHGVRPRDRVALMVEDRVEALEAYVACALGGFTAVHVNDRLKAPEVQSIVEDADVRAFLYTAGRAEVAAAVPGLSGLALAAQLEAPLWTDASSSAPEPDVGPEDVAIIGYTSGTTGTPKGVMVSHRSLVRIIRHIPTHYALHTGGRCAFTGTFSFVAGIWGVILPHLYLGGELSFMAGLPPDEWVDRMVREGSQFTYVPTPLAGGFVEAVRARPEVLRTLTSVLHSASALRPDQVRELVETVGPRFIETWGMTETGAPATGTVPGDWLPDCPADDVYASVGRPIHLASVRVLGPDGAPLPPGETGELAVESDTLFAGYFRRPETTAEVLSGGWLRTGDVGRVDAAGYVYITDRLKDMVISGGMNVYPAEVERVLAAMPGVAEVAVFGVPDARWGEAVVAAVVPRPGATLSEESVTGFARERLAGYKKPTRVWFVDALPRNAALKVRKAELRERFPAG